MSWDLDQGKLIFLKELHISIKIRKFKIRENLNFGH